MFSLHTLIRSNGCFHRLTYIYNSYSIQQWNRHHKFNSIKNMSDMADNIKILPAQPKDYDRILDFLRIHFYPEEPMTIGSEPKRQDAADEESAMSNIYHGTCMIALQPVPIAERNHNYDDSEVLVGTIIAGPKHTDEAERLFEEATRIGATKWGHCLQFLACVERDANVFERYEVEKALHVHCLAVDSRVRGMALGTRLMKKLMDLGRRSGYPLITADCTSVYSSRLCQRLDMECVNCMAYADYLDENGKVVFKPPSPHICCETYAKRL